MAGKEKGCGIFLLFLTGMIGICLCGCAGRNMGSSYGEERTTYIYGDMIQEDSGITLASKLNVPSECDIAFDTGKSKLSEIRLVDKDIAIPETDRAYVVDYEKMRADAADIQKMVESVFDKDAGIYCRDDGDEDMTKDEIQRDIDLADIYRQQAIKDGQPDVAEMYEDDIDDMKSRQKLAPDTYAPVSEYGMNKIYVGENEGERYSLWISGHEDTDAFRGMSIMYDEAGDQKLDELAMVENAVYVETVPESAASAAAAQIPNICTVTENAAEGEAVAFLSKLGLSGLACTGCEPAVRSWQDSSFSTIKMEKNGYVFSFGCRIGGIDVLYKDMSYVDNLSDDEGYIMQEGDLVYVYIDDDGVFYVSARICTDTGSFVKKEVSLLTWDEMLAAADKSIAEYYRKYPTAYSKVEFNNIELLYVPEAKEDGKIQYIPAWVFTQTDRNDVLGDGVTYDENISQAVCINAVDGKYIDIMETSKAMGTWDNYGGEENIAKDQ